MVKDFSFDQARLDITRVLKKTQKEQLKNVLKFNQQQIGIKTNIR